VRALEYSLIKNPEIYQECSSFIIKDIVFSSNADNEIKKFVKTHFIVKGYFIPYKKSQPPLIEINF